MRIANLDELIGKRVVITADAGTLGYCVAPRHLAARRLAAVGTVTGWVPGHGGDVVWVEQEGTPPDAEPIAPYCHIDELEFYSVEALVFALDKVKALKPLEEQVDELKRRRGGRQVMKNKRAGEIGGDMPKVKRAVYRVRWGRDHRAWQITWPDGRKTWWPDKTKAAAVREAAGMARGAAMDGRLTQLVVHNKNGRISFERTYPRSSDPKRSKG